MNKDLGGLLGQPDEQVRLMVRVAHLYHERGLRQSDIAAQLHISQPRVSRLLKRAVETGVVRTTVTLPVGIHTDLEERLEQAYGLRQAIIADAGDEDDDVTWAIGTAAAEYLSASLIGDDTVGISSWSATLIAAINELGSFRTRVVNTVVQLVGGMGDPRVQMQATRLTGQFAARTGADPLLLPTPGLLGSAEAKKSLMADSTVSGVVECWSRVTVALVGIGAMEPSDLAKQSGNVFPAADLAALEARGAVGDVCFRFYDAAGALIDSSFHDRVIGIDPEVLRQVERRVGVAGGRRKIQAIRGAMLGGWINILVTDRLTAQALVHLAA